MCRSTSSAPTGLTIFQQGGESIWLEYGDFCQVARGGHAHKECLEVIIAASGSFTVTLNDGKKQEDYLLNRPDQGLLVNTGIWRTLHDFSSGSVCFVLASELYDAEDYIYEFEDFLEYAKENNGI